MFRLSHTLKQIRSVQAQAGFTMIELLIVITILGILATAVLSAINPIEQINRGRDTGSQSDAEQMISAIDRYYAFNGTYPWQGTGALAANNDPILAFQIVNNALEGIDQPDQTAVLSELSLKNELKESFLDRIDSAANPLYVFNGGNNGDSTYVCFIPLSESFLQKAKERCGDDAGTGMPGDVDSATAALMCAGAADEDARTTFHCLP